MAIGVEIDQLRVRGNAESPGRLVKVMPYALTVRADPMLRLNIEAGPELCHKIRSSP